MRYPFSSTFFTETVASKSSRSPFGSALGNTVSGISIMLRLGSPIPANLRCIGAGDEGRTVEDVLLRALGLAVRAADFG